jgi:hypothetical protein
MVPKVVNKMRGDYDKYFVTCSGVPKGGGGGFKPPRNSEVLAKLSRIPSSVEYTSVTT